MIPPALIENLAAGLCIPWCGAGISMPSGLPSWNALVEGFVAAAEQYGLTPEQKGELEAMRRGNAFEEVVDFCRDFLGEGQYRNYLQRNLEAGRAPNPLHDLIAGWKVPAVLTSNYDRLIERAIAIRTGDLPRVLAADDTQTLWQHLAKGEYFILKVHGDIVRPKTVVLTSRDYTKHVFGNLPFMTFMQRLFVSRSILFVGSSLQDLYIKRILEETTHMTEGVGMPHFALLTNPGPIRTRLLRDRYNIIAVSYDPSARAKHEEALLDVLTDLSAKAFGGSGSVAANGLAAGTRRERVPARRPRGRK